MYEATTVDAPKTIIAPSEEPVLEGNCVSLSKSDSQASVAINALDKILVCLLAWPSPRCAKLSDPEESFVISNPDQVYVPHLSLSLSRSCALYNKLYNKHSCGKPSLARLQFRYEVIGLF